MCSPPRLLQHFACQEGQAAIVAQLLEAGAPADVLDGNGLTPYSMALQNGCTQVLPLLQAALG